MPEGKLIVLEPLSEIGPPNWLVKPAVSMARVALVITTTLFMTLLRYSLV